MDGDVARRPCRRQSAVRPARFRRLRRVRRQSGRRAVRGARPGRGAGAGSHCARPATEAHAYGPTSGPPSATCVRDFMRDDFLSPVLSKLLAPDLVQWFLPSPLMFLDRSIALESSWSASYCAGDGEGHVRARIPGVVGGRGVVASACCCSTPRMSRAVTATSRRPSTRASTRTAAIASSSTTPAISCETGEGSAAGLRRPQQRALHLRQSGRSHSERRRRRPRGVVDGGYFENSGLATLGEVYRQLVTRGVTPVALYLCNDPQTCGQTRSRPVCAERRRRGRGAAAGAVQHQGRARLVCGGVAEERGRSRALPAAECLRRSADRSRRRRTTRHASAWCGRRSAGCCPPWRATGWTAR